MKNKILLITLIIVIVFITTVTLYKLKNNTNIDNVVHSVRAVKIDDEKKELIYSDILDEEQYKNYITAGRKTMDYSVYGETSINGQIYIDDNSILHVTNEVNKEDVKVSDIKFKYLYYPEVNIYENLFVYLISQDYKLYTLVLKSENLKDIEINPIEFAHKALNFSNISYNNDISPSGNTLFILAEDGNIYEVASGLRYHENINLLFDRLIVYEDNTMANIFGSLLKDRDGNLYKIKYAFNAKPNPDYLDYDSIMIVTDDNKLLLLLDVDDYQYLYESSVKIVNISFDKNYPFELGKLNIEFKNDEKFTFDARCSIYNCINDLDV